MNSQNIKKYTWTKQAMDITPLNGSTVCYAISYLTQQVLGESFGILYLYFKKGQDEVFFPQERIDRLGQYFLKQKDNVDELFRQWQKIAEEVINNAEKIRKSNLEKSSEKELFDFVKKEYELFGKAWIHGGFVEVYDNTSENILSDAINKAHLEKPLTQKEIITLLEPNKLAIVQEEREDMIQLLKTIKEKSKGYKDFFKNSEIKKLIEAHREKYYFMKGSYGFADEITFQSVVGHIKKDLQKGDFEKELVELKKIKKHYQELPKLKEKIIKTHKLSDDLVETFHFFSTLSVWRDQRKKMHQISSIAMNKIAFELCHRHQISNELGRFFWIGDLINGYVNIDKFKEELARRSQESMLVIDDSAGIEWFYGDKAKNLKDRLDETIFQKSSSVIKGMPASPGKVTGIVKIIKSTESFPKFNHDDILVSSMTRVEFMPVVRKASAIVTDEGGITSHAAIVSRELGVPAVIGTKIATKVLKDGDFVEVDANKGVVRKLK